MNEEYLYHYTSVESLAMILKNCNFRFSPLTNLDDIQEEQSIGPRKYGKYIFVSSWTDKKEESIPMWKMYTDIESGVRIKLRKFPFKKYKISKDEISNGNSLDLKINGENLFSYVSTDVLLNSKYMIMNWQIRDFLVKVIYTSDSSKLVPKIEKITQSEQDISYGKLGTYKNNYWEFQSEWRYIIKFAPGTLDDFVNDRTFNMLMHGYDLPFYNYFLSIDEECFNEMEITLSPLISNGNKLIVESLVEKYNKSATIKNSSLSGLLRF